MTDLHRENVFLSASFPSGKRGEKFAPYDASGIADAVTALVRGVLSSNGRLVFGGHPTITPLVLMIAREVQVKWAVTVYQSAWFEDQQLPEVQELANEKLGRIVWTERKYECEASIGCMRDTMIKSSRRWCGAVFVGGMEGVVDEFRRVNARSTKIPCAIVAGPGGAAARLLEHDRFSRDDRFSRALSKVYRSRAYPLVALQVVEAIEKAMRNDGIRD